MVEGVWRDLGVHYWYGPRVLAIWRVDRRHKTQYVVMVPVKYVGFHCGFPVEKKSSVRWGWGTGFRKPLRRTKIIGSS